MASTIGVHTRERNWRMAAFRGVLAILFGIIALVFPHIALLAFVLVFGIYAIIDGIASIIMAIRERATLRRWGWVLFDGILSLAAGTFAILYPGITALILLFIVASWAILTGIMEIVSAFTLREHVGHKWPVILAGLISLAFGILLFLFPGAGLLSLLWLVGIYSVLFGITIIIHAFQMRSWSPSLEHTMA